VIDKKEFCLALGRTESPFMNRLFDLFDVDGSGTIDFREFLTGLNNATKGTQEDKIRCTSFAHIT
jgi:Ca2+-binding EF-hand superfamily protein